MSRFFCKNITSGEIPLDKTEAHHLINVMRISEGKKIELFDGNGTTAQALIVSIKRKDVIVNVEQITTKLRRKIGSVIIATSTARGQRFDWLISKCTELGVDKISPVIFDRTVKLARGKTALERLSKLVISAAKQCGKNFLPEITESLQLSETIESLQTEYPQAIIMFGSLSKDAKPVIDVMEKDKDVIAFIGPEGGMTKEEKEALRNAGGIEAKLTDTILRIETAAIAFASILCADRDRAI